MDSGLIVRICRIVVFFSINLICLLGLNCSEKISETDKGEVETTQQRTNPSQANNVEDHKKEENMQNKSKKIVKKIDSFAKRMSTAQKAEIPDFFIDIQEVKTSLPNTIWYIPSDKPIFCMSLLFKGCGSKNYQLENPALGMFLDLLEKGAGNMGQYEIMKNLYQNNTSLVWEATLDNLVVAMWAPASSYKDPLNLIPVIFQKPKLKGKLFSKKRQELEVLLEEAEKYPTTKLSEAKNKARYPDGHPYRVSHEKIKKNIWKVKSDDVREFLKLLSQENAVVVVLGPKDMKTEIVENIEKMLLKFPKVGKQQANFDLKLNEKMEDIHVKFENPSFIISAVQGGFRAIEPNFYAKSLALASVGGASLQSLMYQEIREKMGLVYSCSGRVVENDEDCYIEYNLGTRDKQKALEALNGLLKKVSAEGIKKENFELVKQEKLGSAIVWLNSCKSFLWTVANKRALGFNIKTASNFCEGYKKVTHAEVNAACKEIFNPSELVVVSVGN